MAPPSRLGHRMHRALVLLDRHGELTVADLRRRMRVAHSTTAATVDRLLAGGLVAREGRRSLGHRRGTLPWVYALTRAGRRSLRLAALSPVEPVRGDSDLRAEGGALVPASSAPTAGAQPSTVAQPGGDGAAVGVRGGR